MVEFDPMAELGLVHDKQIICSCTGFLNYNEPLAQAAGCVLNDEGKLYRGLDRYESIVSFVMGRDGRSGNLQKELALFLAGYRVSDAVLAKRADEGLRLLDHAKETVDYLISLMPTTFFTSAFEHHALALSKALDIPIDYFRYSTVDLEGITDDYPKNMTPPLRKLASYISGTRLASKEYRLNKETTIERSDETLVEICDDILEEIRKNTVCNNIMESVSSMGQNQKAYALLDIRKQEYIDFDGTMFVGSDPTDYHALDLVKDGGGLALSFNGSEFAIHGCNVAALTRDCNVVSLLAQTFYNRGIEAVYDLVVNWERPILKNMEFSDRGLLNTVLKDHPRKLPELYIVDSHNVEKIADKSIEYRKKLLNSGKF